MSHHTSLKHLTVLRKALSKRKLHTGYIDYNVFDQPVDNIEVTKGVFSPDDKTIEQLKIFLTQPLESSNLIIRDFDKPSSTVPPPIAFTKALNEISWGDHQLQAMKKAFSSLPPITVDIVSMHKIGYLDGLSYLSLYQASLKPGVFMAKDFLDEKKSYSSLEKQMKVLVLGYCLGLINPNHHLPHPNNPPATSTKKPAKGTHSGMASMILAKLRGL